MTLKEQECLSRLEAKLECIHKDVEQNAKEISQLKATVNMGKGAVKALIWLGSILLGIIGLLQMDIK